MKEATGELSMTVIVIIGAIALVVLMNVLMPNISKYIQDKWFEVTGTKWDENAGKTCEEYAADGKTCVKYKK